MVIVAGPLKLDFIFDEPHNNEPPWHPEPNNLAAIDAHFWDWTVWLLSKQVRGRTELVATELQKMFNHLLHPVGVQAVPVSLEMAVASYLVARARLERDLAVVVPRALEHEVVRALGEGLA